ncbi:MAG: hypothetical protein GY715_07340 [Planctomycetes bacterium]|nr:hypothetical protein [Planctomycetota bacterium]
MNATNPTSSPPTSPPTNPVRQLAIFSLGVGGVMLIIAVAVHLHLEHRAVGAGVIALTAGGLANLFSGAALAWRRSRAAVMACTICGVLTFLAALVAFAALLASADSVRVGRAIAALVFMAGAMGTVVHHGRRALREIDPASTVG